MNTPLWINSGLVLDARRAAWLPREETLVISDLHLGLPRATGEPVEPEGEKEEGVARLLALVADYHPKKVALVGDLVHPFADPERLILLLSTLLNALREHAAVVLLGTATPELTPILAACDWHAELPPYWVCGNDLLLQGSECELPEIAPLLVETTAKKGSVIIGTENPCLPLKGSTEAYPCFLLAEGLVVLPSFSPALKGNDILTNEPHCALARQTQFRYAVAIRDRKLVPTRLYPHSPEVR